MNKKSFILIAFLFLLFNVCKAQVNYLPGHAILSDGTRINGLIAKLDNDPWFNQRFILLKDSAALVANPNLKAKRYGFNELKSYQVGSFFYDKVHFVDTENLQLKSLGANDHMLERLANGRINAYRFYSYPLEVEAFLGTEQEYIEWQKKNKNDLMTGYKILLTKDKETKPKNAFDTDLQKYLGDTPEVWQKFQSGGYGNEPIVKKGLAAKMIAMAKRAAFKPQEADAIVAAINDYNQKNTSKP